jgi:hypothetical protein
LAPTPIADSKPATEPEVPVVSKPTRCAGETGKEYGVRVSDDTRSSEPYRPQAVRRRSRDRGRSVGRGVHRPTNRAAKVLKSRAPTLLVPTEGNMDACEIASTYPALRGRRGRHVYTFLAREPGELRIGHQLAGGPRREDDES